MRDAEFLIEAMAGQLRDLLARRGISEPVLVGIHSGGVWIAERLHQRLEVLRAYSHARGVVIHALVTRFGIRRH